MLLFCLFFEKFLLAMFAVALTERRECGIDLFLPKTANFLSFGLGIGPKFYYDVRSRIFVIIVCADLVR